MKKKFKKQILNVKSIVSAPKILVKSAGMKKSRVHTKRVWPKTKKHPKL